MESDQHFSKFHGDAPARFAEIEQFEANASFKLPKDYGRFLKRWNGGEGFIGPNAYVILWKLEELMELNKAYQVADCVTGIGSFAKLGRSGTRADPRRDRLRPHQVAACCRRFAPFRMAAAMQPIGVDAASPRALRARLN